MRIRWLKILLEFGLFLMVTTTCAMFAAASLMNDVEHWAETVSRKPDDFTAPTIRLKGDEEISIYVGEEYKERGAETFDTQSVAKIKIESNVDTTKAGEYEVKYTATDESGNSSTVTRKVTVKKSSGVVYLTFDDGPSEHTGRLLDILNKYGVKATFFVTGYGDDDLIRREYEEGHRVALHTFTHTYSYVYSSVDNYFADLQQVSDRVKSITGETSNLIRFPGGSSNTVSTRYDDGAHIMSQLIEEVEKRGYHYFDWNISSGDAGETTSTEVVYNRVTNGLKYGGSSVVLQHDVKGFSVDAVEGIIQYGLENGFTFKALDTDSYPAHHPVNN